MKIVDIITEGKRIPRKKGQKRKSKKHSDLYTDEDPKGTIHGLGFKDEATARSSVSKIRKSGRSQDTGRSGHGAKGQSGRQIRTSCHL